MTSGRPGNGAAAKPATTARIYDYLLGGTHNFPADREAADAIMGMFPQTRQAAKINRAFLGRAVRYLCRAGITQFLDIGSGIPTEGNVHEIAQEASSQARVVYVDIDPVAVAESQELLEGNDFAIAIQGDAHDPQAILNHPQVRKVLDFQQPIGVLLVALLHFINDDDEARAVVRQLLETLAPGSYLVVSHVVDEPPDIQSEEDLKRVYDIYRQQTSAMLRLRTMPEIGRFFDGLEIVEPGVVWAYDWHPAPDDPRAAPDDLARYVAAGGVGRVPVK
jgi:S-adenosyl methyltransferase